MLTPYRSRDPHGACLCSLNPEVSLRHPKSSPKLGPLHGKPGVGGGFVESGIRGTLNTSTQVPIWWPSRWSVITGTSCWLSPLPAVLCTDHPLPSLESYFTCPRLSGVYFLSPILNSTLPASRLPIPLTSLLTFYVLLTCYICWSLS